MNVLVVLNDPPYGTERAYNALRLTRALASQQDVDVRVFLVADAVGCAIANQKVPQGYYNLADMTQMIARRGGTIGVCGTCMDARAVLENQLVQGARRSSLDEWAEWVVWADKVITF